MTDTIESFVRYRTANQSLRTQELSLAYLERERIAGNAAVTEWPESFAQANRLVALLVREARLTANLEMLLEEEIASFTVLSPNDIDVRTKSGRLFSVNTIERTTKEL